MPDGDSLRFSARRWGSRGRSPPKVCSFVCLICCLHPNAAESRLLSVYHATNNPAALPLHSHLQQRGVQALRRSPSDDATIECVNDILSASEFFGRHGWGARAVEAVDEVSAAPLLARLPPELLIDVGVTAYAAYASATLVGVEGLVGGKAHVRESALAASAALPSLPVPSAALWCNIAALPHISSGALSFHDPLLNSSSGSSGTEVHIEVRSEVLLCLRIAHSMRFVM